MKEKIKEFLCNLYDNLTFQQIVDNPVILQLLEPEFIFDM